MDTSEMTVEEKRRLLELLRKKQKAQEMEGVSVEAKKVEDFATKAKDVVKAAGSGLAQGTIGLGQLANLPSQAAEFMVNTGIQAAGGPKDTFGASSLVGQSMEDLSGKVNYAPQTGFGRYTKSVAESAPAAALGPGSWPLKAAGAFGSGMGAQLGADMTRGEDGSQGDNPLARFAGAAIGGAAPWALAGNIKNAPTLMHESVQYVTPGDFTKAQRLQKILEQNRVDAFLKTQLLGPNSTADDLVQAASGYSHTKPLLERKVQSAPRETGEAMGAWIDKNLPPQVASRREMLGDIQQQATNRIKAGERLSNLKYSQNMPKPIPSTPGMTQARANYPVSKMMDMQTELLELADSPKFVNSEASVAIKKFVNEKLTKDGIPITNRWGLNNVYKDLNALRTQEGWKGLPDNVLREVIKKYTPDFDAARMAKAETMAKVVEPMQKGLTGDLARMGGGIKPDRYTALETAFNRVFTPDRNQAGEIQAFADQIGKDEFSQFFGEYLRKNVSRELNRASTVQGPYKLGLSLARTPEQMANLNASLKVVSEAMGAKPAEVTKGFSNLMRAFDTYKDLKIAPNLNQADIGQRAGVNAGALVVAPFSRLGRALTDMEARKAYMKITEMALAPDGLKQLEKLARIKPTSVRMRAFLDGLVQSTIQGMAAEKMQTSPMTEDIIKGAQ